MNRVELTLREQDAALLRALALQLRRNDAGARRIRTLIRGTVAAARGPTVAEVMATLPDISGPEFDAVFDEIERFRHDPIMMKVRDIEL